MSSLKREIESTIEKKFSGSEANLILEFLRRGFSQNGQIAISGIFLFAKERGKTVAEVLAACEKEWAENWQYQHPDIKGDPDIVATNLSSLKEIYGELGLPFPPVPMASENVPSKALKVKTRNSTYSFGRVDGDGKRRVSRQPKPIDFKRCKILYLIEGESMVLDTLEGGVQWRTSEVISIE